MMKRILFFSLLLFFSLSSFSQSNDEAAVHNVLTTQQIAWNTGSIDNFMKGYWQSDSLMFVGKSGITYGWQTTLEHYKKGYADTAAMGKLAFTLLELKPLSAAYFFVVGKWHLQRNAGNLEGYFTLLFKKIDGHWLIITDHTD